MCYSLHCTLLCAGLDVVAYNVVALNICAWLLIIFLYHRVAISGVRFYIAAVHNICTLFFTLNNVAVYNTHILCGYFFGTVYCKCCCL